MGAKDIEHLEQQDRLSELEHKARLKWLAELEEKQRQFEYQNRAASFSSESSTYDTPQGSPAPTTAKAKGNLKNNIEQVINALSFSFSDSRLTRSSFKRKEGTGWPPKS